MLSRSRASLSASIAGVLITAALSIPAAATESGVWLSSLSTARSEAVKTGKLILVDLYAEWCGWCKVLEREVFNNPKFIAAAKEYVLLRVDVEDRAEGSMLQSRFEANSLPTTLLLDSDLVLVGEIQGFLPVDSFLAQILTEKQEHGRLLALYERARAGKDSKLLLSVAKELHLRGDGKRAAPLYERLADAPSASPSNLPWLRYWQADALRLAGQHDQALAAMDQARRAANAGPNAEVIEALDLLRMRIARDSGQCQRAIDAANAFLAAHPKSEYRSFARETLRELQRQTACT